MINLSSTDHAAQRALAQRDLTDPHAGPHALQQLITDAHAALAESWRCRRELHRGTAVISAAQGAASDSARRLSPQLQLRPHMRVHLPGLLGAQALDPPEDLLLACPGVVYRRSAITPLHAGEPHQLDLWRLRRGRLGSIELAEMVRAVLAAMLPGRRYRLLPSARPHLSHGMRVEIASEHGWTAIGRIGLLAPAQLTAAGLDPADLSVMGMTLGLDRMLMLRKGIAHIRLLRSSVPAVAAQMLDLAPYRPPSPAPAQIRELVMAAGNDLGNQDLADRIRTLLPDRLDLIEQAELLPDGRLRLSLRHPGRALRSSEADTIRDEVAGLVARPTAPARAVSA